LKDDVFHIHNGVPQYDLISQDELIKLVGALNQLSEDEKDAILDDVDNLDINTITINDIELMVSQDSSIIRTLVSEKILEMDDFEVHPDAIVDGEIAQIELENLFAALGAGLGDESNIDALTSIADTISI